MIHAIASCGVTLSQLKLLHVLARPHDQPPRISRIGTMLELSPQQATRLVTGLERQRLVDRIEDDEDARVRRVVITPKGRELVHQLDRERVAGAQRFFRELTPEERRGLDDALEPIARRPDVAVYLPASEPE